MSDKDIFGTDVPFGQVTLFPPALGVSTTASDKLVQWLTGVATASLGGAWAQLAQIDPNAEQGQNVGKDSLIQTELAKPTALDRDKVLAAWSPPDMPTLKDLPALPDGLLIDLDKAKITAGSALNDISYKFATQYLPLPNDLKAYDNLLKDVVDGSSTDTADKKLDGLWDDAKTAADTIRKDLTNALSKATADAKNDLDRQYKDAASNLAGAQSSAGSSLAAANTALGELRSLSDKAFDDANKGIDNAIINIDSRLVDIGADINAVNGTAKDSLANAKLFSDDALAKVGDNLKDLKADLADAQDLVKSNLTIAKDWMATVIGTVGTDLGDLKTDTNDALKVVKDSIAEAKTGLDLILTKVTDTLATTKADVATALALVTTNATDVKLGINQALAIAKDNTQNIAWARFRDQVVSEKEREKDAIVTDMASRGFDMPSGVMLNRLGKADQEIASATSSAASEQAVKTQGFFLDIAQKNIDALERIAAMFVDVSKTGIEYNFRSDAQVIANAMAKVDAILKNNAQLLDLSKETIATLFRHFGVEIDISKTGLDTAFKNDAFSLDVEKVGIGALVDTTKLSVQIQTQKIDAALKSDSFTIEIQKIGIDAYLKNEGISVDLAKNKVDAYLKAELAHVDLTKTDLDKLLGLAKISVDITRAQIDGALKAMDAQLNAAISAYKSELDQNLRLADADFMVARERAKQAFDNLGLRLDFTKYSAGEAIRYRLGCMQAMHGLIQAYSAARTNEVTWLENVSRAQRDSYQSVMAYYETALKQADIGFRIETSNKNIESKWIDQASAFIGQAVAHHLEAAVETARIAAMQVGSSLAGLNAIASTTVTQ